MEAGLRDRNFLVQGPEIVARVTNCILFRLVSAIKALLTDDQISCGLKTIAAV